jgi:hypothetical protein
MDDTTKSKIDKYLDLIKRRANGITYWLILFSDLLR